MSKLVKPVWTLKSFVFSTVVFLLLQTTVCGQEPVEIPDALLKIIRSVNVAAETEGVISRMEVAPGDLVSAGQLLARIKQDAAELTMEAAELEYRIAKAKVENNIDIRYSRKAHEVAKSDLRRALEINLRVNDTIAAAEIDHRRLIAERTGLEIEQAEHNDRIENLNLLLKQNAASLQKVYLDRHEVRAPIDGMVVAVQRAEGEWANTSDTLVRIVRIDRLRVEDFVPVQVAPKGIQGKSVTFVPSISELRSNVFHGKVVFVSPEANTVDSSVRIWAEIENTDMLLRPGLKGMLTINLDSDPSSDTSDPEKSDR